LDETGSIAHGSRIAG